MKTCTSGKVEVREKAKKKWWYIRLYFVETDSDTAKKKYSSQYFKTELPGTRSNKTKAEKLMVEMIESYAPLGEESLFSDFCKDWLKKKKETLELTTYEGYEYKAGHIISYFESAEIKVAELDSKHTEDFYKSLLEHEKTATSQKNERGLANRTIKDIATLFRTIVEDAYTLDYIKDSKTVSKIKKVKYPQRPEDIKERPYISPEMINLFMEAIRGNRLEYAFLIALFYGLRREEICGLKWSCIRDGKIHIERTVAKVKTVVEKERTKTRASNRSHPISPLIEEILDKIKEGQQLNKKLLGNEYHDNGYIFTWEDGRPYRPDYYSRTFRKVVDASDGLPKGLKLHDLRASCTSIFINANVSPKAVQNWTGHKDFETMFNRYARADMSEEMKLALFMENLIKKAS